MSADLIARLIQAGTPAGLVAEVAMALGAAQADSAAIAERRERDARRQQERRDREKAARLAEDQSSRDVTLRNVTSCDTADEIPAPDKSPPHPQKLTPTPGKHTHTRARGADRVFACPEGVDPQHWADFLANRKGKRLANTATAYRAQLKALADLSDDEWPPGRIVEFAAARGWGAFFDPRGRDDGNRNGTRAHGLGGNRAASASGYGPSTDAGFAFISDGGPH